MSAIRDSLRALRETLATPAIARLQAAVAGSSIGQWMASVVLMVLCFQGGGAAGVGALVTLRMLPAALAAPLLGTLADRRSRRTVMLVSDLTRAVITLGAAAVAFTGADYRLLILASALNGLAGAAFEPARAAILPSLAERPEDLTAANVVASTIESVALTAGPALGAALFAVTSGGVVLVTTSAFLLFSAAMLSRIPADLGRPDDADREAAGEHAARGFRHEVLDGLRAVTTHRGVRLIVVLLVAQLFVDGALGVLTVSAAIDELGMGESGLGTLNAVLGAGALLGAVGAVGLIAGRRLAAGVAVGMAMWGLPVLALGLAPVVPVALAGFFVIGVGNTILDISGYTLLQRSAPPAVIGRVFGVFESLSLGSYALGGAVTAILVDATGIPATLVLVGALLPALAVLGLPGLRRAEAEAVGPPAAALALLRRVPMLHALPALTMEALAERAERVAAAPGGAIIRQGEPGDRFYVVEDGTVEVLVDGARVREQGPGEGFGEIALLRDVPRTATVRAVTAVTLLALEREDFLAAVTGHTESLEAAGAVAGARLSWARPAVMT